MRTTTAIFKFIPEISQEMLDTRVSTHNSYVSPVLQEFCELHSMSTDNLVSETTVHETCLRTVVRSWPDLDTATAWVAVLSGYIKESINNYPGTIQSIQVDPE